jgi:predicted amidohydrolase
MEQIAMKRKVISVVALNNRDYPSFEAKLSETAQWIEFAARQGSELVVLPEALNMYQGDGTPRPTSAALREDTWQERTTLLFETAVKAQVAVTIPIVMREGDHRVNVFYLVSNTGAILGRYQKRFLTPGELEGGVQPGTVSLLEWEGLKVGGAICFDTCSPCVFEEQVRAGAQLFLIPSLWPGGSQLNHYARTFSTPMALAYPAWSRIIDITGADVVAGGHRHETLRLGFGPPVFTAALNFDCVALYGNDNQDKMVAVQRAYGARVKVQFDQQNCLFFLESVCDDLTVGKVMREFGLISARDYFAQCERMNEIACGQR